MSIERDDLTYYSGGRLLDFGGEVQGLSSVAPRPQAPVPASTLGRRALALLTVHEAIPMAVPEPSVTVWPTDTIHVEGAREADLRWVRRRFGAEVMNEGLEGKVLLQAPLEDGGGIRAAFAISRELYQRGTVQAAHPNFVRALHMLEPSPEQASVQWNHDNSGDPGLIGADVSAHAGWTITRGDPDIAVAILDDGVDTSHPDLKSAVVAEKDLVANHPHARPDADDAHGTRCAGIVASRSGTWPGLASQVSLMAVRIAKGNEVGTWTISNFSMSDGIDWAWRNGASVLSNSWVLGLPVDGIRLAFQRARKRGRSGRGAVVVVAAGNDEVPVGFPGAWPGTLTVGASNQWDEPKSRTSRDGESWWGSNYGEAVGLLAPGVRIVTTDRQGSWEAGSKNVTFSFNGTSAATPHVAAAAALVLSVAPHLSESQVRQILMGSAERVPGWRGLSRKYGRGRLNVYTALRAARRR